MEAGGRWVVISATISAGSPRRFAAGIWRLFRLLGLCCARKEEREPYCICFFVSCWACKGGSLPVGFFDLFSLEALSGFGGGRGRRCTCRLEAGP